MKRFVCSLIAFAMVATLASTALAKGPQPDPMTFFVASVGSGEGADLGGLDEPTRSVRACRRSGCGRPHMACLPQHARPERGECSRPHRHRPMA